MKHAGRNARQRARAEGEESSRLLQRWLVASDAALDPQAFIISPEIKFTPYKLRQEELEVVDLEDKQEAIDLPPPEIKQPEPPKVIEAAPDDEVTEEVDIADTMIDFDPPEIVAAISLTAAGASLTFSTVSVNRTWSVRAPVPWSG